MKIKLLWTGRTRESWIAEGIKKYMALLGPMAKVEAVEVKDERPGAGGRQRTAAMEKEADRILAKAGNGFILLEESGRAINSRGLAGLLKDRSSVEFVLGGPYGVSGRVRDAASERISLSPMTFTHEMARVILLEQVYRALMILNGRPYHN
jgi:23S rRNA (pseudouridine1915-N3)-methyltransferase